MSRRNGDVRQFGMIAKLGTSAALSGDLRAYPGGRQVVYLESNDAGALLRFTDMYSRVDGGQMWIAMDPPTADQQPQEGVINVRDFSIRGESELQRVAANSYNDPRVPTQQFGAGVSFARMRAEFTRQCRDTPWSASRRTCLAGPRRRVGALRCSRRLRAKRGRPSRCVADDPVLQDMASRGAPQRWSDQPRFVMMRSLLIPGWGQLYNKAYFKAGLVIGAEGWLIGALISDSHKLEDLQRTVDEAYASGDTAQAHIATNAYNDRLDTFVGRQWLLAGVVVYALLDAYVDAHFKNFDIEFRPDAPAPGTLAPTQRLDLRWKF
jgi:hypothetical protein